MLPLGYEPALFQPPGPARKADLLRQRGWDDAFVFLNLGALTANKGIVQLLQAFATIAREFPHTRLVLKGLDTLYRSRASLKEYVSTLSPHDAALVEPRLHYLGQMLPPTEVAELYQAADVYVTPYHFEGFHLPARSGRLRAAADLHRRGANRRVYRPGLRLAHSEHPASR